MGRSRELAELATGYDSGGGFGFKNRIINGDMRIDQRNAGASVTSGFAVDRFEFQENGAAAFTIQRSTVAPAGFTNSMLVTVTTAGSATAAQVNRFFQRIEGNNIADLGFGTASASTVTLSFWVRSSLTGTYCAALVNNAANRAYVAEYSISAANTWEYKTISIAGDTTGTWETGTSSGVQVTFDLGSGSDYNATAGSWVAANDWRTTNQANFANTNGATFYITGVQLEKGSAATPFDFRNYSTELSMCERYRRHRAVWVEKLNTSSGELLAAVDITGMRALPGSVNTYDYAGNLGKVSTLDITGNNTNNVTPSSIGAVTLTGSNSMVARVYITASTAAGLVATLMADSEL